MSVFRKEILELKARLADAKKQIEEFEMKSDAQIMVIRDKVDPYSNLDEMDLKSARVALNELISIQENYIKTKKLIKEMESDLG